MESKLEQNIIHQPLLQSNIGKDVGFSHGKTGYMYTIFAFWLIAFNLCAQETGIFPNSKARMETMVVDSGSFRILYAMNAVDIYDEKTYDDLQRLEIGNGLSKYYSYYLFRNDSLIIDFGKKNVRGGIKQPGEVGKKGFWWSLFIWSDYFKDFKTNEFTEYALMPGGIKPNRFYTEEIPKQDWDLQDDTLTICGYSCQKATCRFRVRDYVAWFAAELPVSNGPWKFGGLPGLILKVFDTDNYYVFECIKIENHTQNFPIIMYDTKQFQSIERLKLSQLNRDIYADYYKLIQFQDAQGIPMKFTPVPYHPLELE